MSTEPDEPERLLLVLLLLSTFRTFTVTTLQSMASAQQCLWIMVGMLRPVRADQSEQTGLFFCRGALKRRELKRCIHTKNEQMS